MPDVLILGGGLAGLAAANAVRREGLEPLVLEAGPRAGGVVGTRELDGFRFEAGPNTLQASARTFRHLCGELGIGHELTPSDEQAKQRWIWKDGRLQSLPGSPPALFTSPLFTRAAKLKVASEPLRRWRAPGAGAPEPTLAELLDERIGPEPTALLAGAFVRGIYAGDHTRLGARSAFPRLWSMLEQHGGLVRGLVASQRAGKRERAAGELPGPDVAFSRLLSLPGGLQRLVDVLCEALGNAVRTEAQVSDLRRVGEEWVAVTSGGEHRAPRVLSALPASEAATLLEPHVDAEHTAFLRGIPHSSVRLAHLGFAPGEVTLPNGFGYLVPPGASGPEVPRTLGTIFASNLFADRAPRGGAAVSCFYALDEVESLDADSFCDRAAADLARALRLPTAPRPAVTWTVTWKRSIPQYLPEHDRAVGRLETHLEQRAPGLALAGSWVAGVSVEHVLQRGRRMAERLCSDLSPVGGGAST